MTEKVIPKTMSEENLAQICEPSKRGRKQKYTTDEERIEARRQQQREYRLRKKLEVAQLKEQLKEQNKNENENKE